MFHTLIRRAKEIMAAADEYAVEAFLLGVLGRISENNAMVKKRSELEKLLDELIVETGN